MKRMEKIIPIRDGSPLKRIHTLTCICGRSVTIDLGARNQGDEIRCRGCGALLARRVGEE